MAVLRWLGALVWLWALVAYAVGAILVTLLVIVPYQWVRRALTGIPMRIR